MVWIPITWRAHCSDSGFASHFVESRQFSAARCIETLCGSMYHYGRGYRSSQCYLPSTLQGLLLPQKSCFVYGNTVPRQPCTSLWIFLVSLFIGRQSDVCRFCQYQTSVARAFNFFGNVRFLVAADVLVRLDPSLGYCTPGNMESETKWGLDFTSISRYTPV